MKALDLFAGGGGWDIAAESLGIEVDGVENMPEAIATREAAGLSTVLDDVRGVIDTLDLSQYAALIASPPCQSFSMAGKGAGRNGTAALIQLVTSFDLPSTSSWPTYEVIAATIGDERAALVIEPLRVALKMLPQWICFEQVPTVLPIWEACAEVLHRHGYSVVTGNLQAEQFGVPQTRKRAILIAVRGGVAEMPTPTHSRYYSRDPQRLDPGVAPWVSMAEALGWGMNARPSMTVCGGGTDTGGAEPFGHGARDGIIREHDAGRWDDADLIGFPRLADTPSNQAGDHVVEIDGTRYRARDLRSADLPSFVVTEKARSWQRYPKVRTGANTEAADGTLTRYERSTDAPSPSRHDPNESGSQQRGSVRVSVEEAACLQSFPFGYPWRGSKTKQYLPVGNAIPPLLARAVLAAASGSAVQRDEASA